MDKLKYLGHYLDHHLSQLVLVAQLDHVVLVVQAVQYYQFFRQDQRNLKSNIQLSN